MQDTKQVIFRLGEGEYGLDIMIVNAIEKYLAVSHVPNAPTCVTGIIDLRGDVIPVYSLRKKFGLPEKEIDGETKLIITKSNGITMAYQVDKMEEIVDIPSNKLKEAPQVIRCKETSYINCVANLNGRLIVLLNHNGILSDSEQEMISELVNNE